MTTPLDHDPIAPYSAELRAALDGWRQAMQNIRVAVSNDRRVASTAALQVVTERADVTRPQWIAHVQDIAARADAVVDDLAHRSSSMLPSRDDSLEAMFDRQARWAGWQNLVAKLNMRPGAAFAQATDPQDVYCLERELPLYYLAQGMNADIRDQVAVLALHRLAELTSPAAVATLTRYGAAGAGRVKLQAMLDHVLAEITGGREANAMHAAIRGAMEQQAETRYWLGQG